MRVPDTNHQPHESLSKLTSGYTIGPTHRIRSILLVERSSLFTKPTDRSLACDIAKVHAGMMRSQENYETCCESHAVLNIVIR